MLGLFKVEIYILQVYIRREKKIGLHKGEAQIFKGNVLNRIPNLETFTKGFCDLWTRSNTKMYCPNSISTLVAF